MGTHTGILGTFTGLLKSLQSDDDTTKTRFNAWAASQAIKAQNAEYGYFSTMTHAQLLSALEDTTTSHARNLKKLKHAPKLVINPLSLREAFETTLDKVVHYEERQMRIYQAAIDQFYKDHKRLFELSERNAGNVPSVREI